MNEISVVKDFYNNGVVIEWNRIVDRPEFLLTCRFLDRYIKPGDKVLDMEGRADIPYILPKKAVM